jgi:hypothetical protein
MEMDKTLYETYSSVEGHNIEKRDKISKDKMLRRLRKDGITNGHFVRRTYSMTEGGKVLVL